MTKLQLLVSDEANRNALRALLDQQYEVVVEETHRTIDCYITDDRTLPVYRDALQEYKREQHPTFTPVILIRRDNAGITVDLTETDSKDGPPLVDEVVSAPVEKQVLYRRIDNLVVRREQSLTLTKQYEASEARFEALFAAIPDPAFVLDEAEKLIEVNDAFCRVVGTERSVVLGQPLDAVRGFGLDSTAHVAQARTNGGASKVTGRTVQLMDGDGETRYATLSVQTVLVEGKSYTVGVLTDITELREKTERLEDFASIVAHDLRNPLQVAQARIEYIEDELGESETHVAAILRSLHRIEDLIDKLLTVARTGEDDFERTEIFLEDCAVRAWKTVETHEARLVTETTADSSVQGDEDRLVQLFENLFRNAIEHGGDEVIVRVGTLTDGFYVEDDGPGIPPEKRDSIFEMGYTTESQGTGLGMNIVAAIVDAHTWEISVTESDDGGARFEITGIPNVNPDSD